MSIGTLMLGRWSFPIELLTVAEAATQPRDRETGLPNVVLEEDVGFRETWETVISGDDDACLRLLEVARAKLGRHMDRMHNANHVTVRAGAPTTPSRARGPRRRGRRDR